MTRKSDYFVTLGNRSRAGNAYNNAIFVSIHFNSASSRSAYGIETWYYHSKSYSLGRYIQQQLCRYVRARSRGVKRRGFSVIRKTWKNPAVLVECGFLTNSSERRKISSRSYRQRLAEGIARGILLYHRSQR